MPGEKCKNCGSSDIEVDSARGDAVCTNCGTVLEDTIIVSEVQFEEGAHGTSNAIGQFVAANSKGGATKLGASFHVGLGIESRELTLQRAREGITVLCNQLQLNQHCIETACNFFKCALNSNLTRGRRTTHVRAACVYLTCRTEGTAHLLIDISDVMQICCYELGRTYLRLSQALHINIPSVDPCLYILRFASKLEFGAKTQQVANTALRLVQRMKRDSIHSGRRPSGLCGAALLIAARLHEFSRTTVDVVKVVKIHETTLRKRLIEFGDTPSSALTLEEFMTVDLEEEQDPPSFKAARKKDKERVQKVLEDEGEKLTEFQREIEKLLEKANKKKKPDEVINFAEESDEAEKFIKQQTLDTVKELLNEAVDDPGVLPQKEEIGLGPNIASMGLANSISDTTNGLAQTSTEVLHEIDMSLDDIDDEEIDAYIMSEQEYQTKSNIWHKINAGYLEDQQRREEKLQKELEEGKPEKKRRRPPKRKAMGPTSSAGEAIEKIVQEKKISNKINYDVLKCLNEPPPTENNKQVTDTDESSTDLMEAIKRRRLSSASNRLELSPAKMKKLTSKLNENPVKRKEKPVVGLPVVEQESDKVKDESEPKKECLSVSEEETDDYDEDEPVQETNDETSVLQMLRQHNRTEPGGEEYDGYESEYGWE